MAAFCEPGEYWEITVQMNTEMKGMPKPMVMPPMKMKICEGSSAKNTANNLSNSNGKNKNCQMTDIETSGDKTTWKISCNRDFNHSMKGTGEVTKNSNSLEGTLHLVSQGPHGAANTTATYSGRHIGGSCSTDEKPTPISAK